MFDLSGMRILFIAYHYPPEGGAGLPGTMRTVKFIRNFINAKMFVLTKECKKPITDSEIALPVNGEIIYRCGSFDVFDVVLKIRFYFNKLLCRKNLDNHQQKNTADVFANSVAKEKEKSNVCQKLKDFIHDICYFPDQASPWIFKAFCCGIRIVKREKIQVIFATGMPWSGLLVGLLLHYFTRKPLIADFRDPWIGNPFHKSKGCIIDFLSQYFERKIVDAAALVTLNTEPLRDEFVFRYPDICPSHFLTLPNGFDLADFKDINFSSDHIQKNNLVLCHAGLLYGLRDPSTILEAIRHCNIDLLKQNTKIIFMQIGNITLNSDVKQQFSDLIQQESFIILPECSYNECINMLSMADILVNVQPGTKTQVPSKLYDYLAINKPILNFTPRDGALGKVVIEYGFGPVFDETEKENIIFYLKDMMQRKMAGTLSAEYPKRYKFNICEIANLLGENISKVC